MPVLTRKRRTDRPERVRLTFTGPATRRASAVDDLSKLGFSLETETADDSLPWRDLFPETMDNLPGTALAGARTKQGITQVELSKLAGIPQRHISEMENGKRTIGKERARRLADALNIPYQTLL